ncbi:MAG: Rrf2 family transcriptional regulator [Candidatus Moranbacteria bacterium]|nr:Rrf2 family transcriptional regulator [Candidatus Moranbacteria bacterium]MDD3964704.1 Rrf2 family transcriptional regulator [Candidatus Moranbacteria bacterium]
MKISKKSYYGLRAILALAQTEKPLSIHLLAEKEHLPEMYLEKILQALRKANLVTAHKGVSGGYVLARRAEKISVWDVMAPLDGPTKIVPSPLRGTLPCLQVSHCQTNEVWRTLENKIENTLSKISLASLIPKNIS